MEFAGIDSKYQLFARRFFADFKPYLFFFLFVILMLLIFQGPGGGMLLFILSGMLLCIIYCFYKNIKTLYKLELIEDGTEIRITFFHYNSLQHIVCKREDFRLNKRLDFGEDGAFDELQLFIDNELYFTQRGASVWTKGKIEGITYSYEENNKENPGR